MASKDNSLNKNIIIKALKEQAVEIEKTTEQSLKRILYKLVLYFGNEHKQYWPEKLIVIGNEDLCPTTFYIKYIYIDANDDVIIFDQNNGEWNYHSLSTNELIAIIKNFN